MSNNDVICPYCHGSAHFTTSKKFYGEDYGTNLYVCYQCKAWVSTHGKGKTPKGPLANIKLRILRKTCHRHFDPMWRKGNMSRGKAYDWLANSMNLSKLEAHIGMFDEKQCKQLLKLLTKKEK